MPQGCRLLPKSCKALRFGHCFNSEMHKTVVECQSICFRASVFWMYGGFSWDRAGFGEPGSKHLRNSLPVDSAIAMEEFREVAWMEGHLRLHRRHLRSRRRRHTHRRLLQSQCGQCSACSAWFSSLCAFGQLSQRDHDLLQQLHERHQAAQAKALQMRSFVEP